MKDIYSLFTTDELWLIKETEWVRSLQNIRESQFALGNGYLGIRGVLEEMPYDAIPGTYIAGLYDKMGSQVDELVNLPNPVNFKFTVEGNKLDVVAMDLLKHRRALNMKKGMLLRQTVYRDTKGRRYDYQSLRFISFENKNIGAMQVYLTALDSGCVVDIDTGIDTSISNLGILSEGRKRHFRVKGLGQSHNAGYLTVDTFDKKHTVSFWSGFYYQTNHKKVFAKDNVFRLKLKKNQTVTFTKIFCIKHFPYRHDSTGYRAQAFKLFYKAFRANFSLLLNNHIKAWRKLWKKADILIEGVANIQQNLRFNIYHMLICAHFDNGFSSIGARTLSGEGYRGHIFWDAEIFLLPFYLFSFPRVAKNMLIYRCRRIDKARELAGREGFAGVKFAWESTDSGEEETPGWARDFDGTVIKIYTHKMEHHITADIAYAVYQYYLATGDEQFMANCGYELIFEAARFWASRARLNKRRRRYEINHVIGPDEFHVDVNNNAFTNMLAKWNLITACKLYAALKHKASFYKKIKDKISLRDKEAGAWKKIASRICVSRNKKNKVIEQFDGFFKLKEVMLKKTDENGIPLLPPRMKAKDLSRIQVVKQADVLMLIYLLSDVFSPRTKTANYNFYIKKTLHKSSLSPAVHAALAAEAGDLNRAYNLFNVALRTDVSNLYGNTRDGIHAASLGGVWQATVRGFGGVKIRKEKLSIDPQMPHSWRKMSFSLTWRKSLIKIELSNEAVKLKVTSPRKKSVEIEVFNRLVSVKPNKTRIFKRKAVKEKQPGYHY